MFMNRARRGLTIVSIGGSNCIGSATGATVLTKPALATYRIQGVNMVGSTYPNPHSIMPGFLDELYNVRAFGSAVNILQWAITTTDLAAWIATHGPNMLADHVTSGFPAPCAIIHDWGGADAQDGAHLDSADDNQDILYASFRRKFGGSTAIYLPLLTTLTQGVYVKAGGVPLGAAWGLWDEMLEYCSRRPTHYGYLDTRVTPYNTTSDQVHRTSASQIAVGRQVCRDFLSAGILG